MGFVSRLQMYMRLGWGLRGFLKEPITPDISRGIIRQRLAERESNLLSIVKRGIYDNTQSPYLKLLNLEHCEYGDIDNLLRTDGIEGMLQELQKQGVYLEIEEFKGRKEIVRGATRFHVSEQDFDNPLMPKHFEMRSGGSRSSGTRTMYDFDYITQSRSVYESYLFEAYGVTNLPFILWSEIIPGLGPFQVLKYAKAGKPPDKWFSPVSAAGLKLSLVNRLATNYIVYMGRLWGSNLPNPVYVPSNEAWMVAQWIAEAIHDKSGCLVWTTPSRVVAICTSAKEKGVDISGTKFISAGEPITSAKQEVVESVGATIFPRYVFVEGGYVGFGCFHPSEPDDIHFFKDSLAIIERKRSVMDNGTSVNAFLFTSLLKASPKILLNVESGDFGVIEKRQCGCKFEELGYNEHIHTIRSFEKLTGQGVTFFNTDLIKIIEDVLPDKFGGTPIDYQMLHQEDDKGLTRMSIIVSPEVGRIDEAEIIQTVLKELGKGSDTKRVMADLWSQAEMLVVKRMKPIATSRGKILHLHLQKKD